MPEIANHMNNRPLLWSATGVLIVLALFLIVSIDQKLNTAPSTNTVTFSGEGKVIVAPDVAKVDLSIVTNASTSKAAQDQNSQRSKALVDFLKKQGVEDKDIKTVGYNIYPQYSYRPEDAPRVTGYQVSQTVQVKVRKLDSVNTILDGAVAAGANQVNSLVFAIDDEQAAREQARELAIKDAQKKADVLEGQLGIRLGRVVSFSENVGGYPPILYADKMMEGRGMGGGGGPSVPVGENEIVVNVVLVYQVK